MTPEQLTLVKSRMLRYQEALPGLKAPPLFLLNTTHRRNPVPQARACHIPAKQFFSCFTFSYLHSLPSSIVAGLYVS